MFCRFRQIFLNLFQVVLIVFKPISQNLESKIFEWNVYAMLVEFNNLIYSTCTSAVFIIHRLLLIYNIRTKKNKRISILHQLLNKQLTRNEITYPKPHVLFIIRWSTNQPDTRLHVIFNCMFGSGVQTTNTHTFSLVNRNRSRRPRVRLCWSEPFTNGT